MRGARGKLLAAIVVLCLTAASGCSGRTAASGNYIKITRPAMGTFVTIMAPSDRLSAIEEAFGEIHRVEDLLSSFVPDSDVSRITRSAGKGSVEVAPETVDVISQAITVYRESEGALDITVGPLLQLWKQSRKRQRAPTREEIQAARKIVGADKITIQRNPPRVGLAAPGMRLDLAAIAKGYIVDCAIRKMRNAGVASALINAGGDIRAIGDKDGRPWRVGIQDPRDPDQPDIVETLALRDYSVATSGNYRQFYEIKGKRHSHIVDPRTGMTADAADSVTVIAPTAAEADAWATALSVLGPKDGLRIVDSKPELECLLIHIVNGKLKETVSKGFKRFVAKRKRM